VAPSTPLLSIVDLDGKPIGSDTGRSALRMLFCDQDAVLAAKAAQKIDDFLKNPKGFPDGKNRRTRLAPTNAQRLKSALIDAVEHASVWAANRPLPNRMRGRGKPPDNSFFLFIDDIVRACEAVGLKPGLRYADGSESLPVHIFIELAPLLWGPVKNPRRLFERWQRYRKTLVRKRET
jgi:hypothetical protein